MIGSFFSRPPQKNQPRKLGFTFSNYPFSLRLLRFLAYVTNFASGQNLQIPYIAANLPENSGIAHDETDSSMARSGINSLLWGQ